MSVILETSLGDITIDLYTADAPLACKNFLKLCAIKYYNNCIWHRVERGRIIQTGDPTGTGRGGESIYGQLYGSQARYFNDEFKLHLKHNKVGLVSMASAGPNTNASQFFITCSDKLSYLDEKNTIFGIVAEGLDVVNKISLSLTDDKFRPLRNIRIKHTIILDDPYPNPPQLVIPPESPPPTTALNDVDHLAEDASLEDPTLVGKSETEIEESLRESAAKSKAVVLEMIGDLPDADIAPPDNVLFVCKLNPVTEEKDLELFFSRFGTIKSCNIIKDWKTGNSLQYAFIEFETSEQAEQAYFKMDNVLIDDCRIKVDFSQSVSQLWGSYRRGDKQVSGQYSATGQKRDGPQKVGYLVMSWEMSCDEMFQ